MAVLMRASPSHDERYPFDRGRVLRSGGLAWTSLPHRTHAGARSIRPRYRPIPLYRSRCTRYQGLIDVAREPATAARAARTRRHDGDQDGPLIDIDERKRAEEALAASERNLKLIIDTIPALAWSARPDGSAEFFNQHYLDFIGLSAEQASGWGWTAAVHPEDMDGLAATWQRIWLRSAGRGRSATAPA